MRCHACRRGDVQTAGSRSLQLAHSQDTLARHRRTFPVHLHAGREDGLMAAQVRGWPSGLVRPGKRAGRGRGAAVQAARAASTRLQVLRLATLQLRHRLARPRFKVLLLVKPGLGGAVQYLRYSGRRGKASQYSTQRECGGLYWRGTARQGLCSSPAWRSSCRRCSSAHTAFGRQRCHQDMAMRRGRACRAQQRHQNVCSVAWPRLPCSAARHGVARAASARGGAPADRPRPHRSPR